MEEQRGSKKDLIESKSEADDEDNDSEDMDTIASEYSAESSTEDDSDKHCSEEDVVQSFSRPVDSRSSAFAILVMGMTGSGKSHFISRLTNGQAKVGHNLESCTPEVARHKLVSERGQEIYLLDTPGFNDSHTSDTSIVVSIALELERLYIRHNLQFAGLVYLHRITDQRVAGSSRQSMRVFERICGEKNYPNVYLVTTMWNLLDPKTADKVGQSREKTLVEKDEFFGSMSTGGAKIERDYGDQGSAREIIQQIVKQKSRFVTTLQQEMCDSKKKLVETSIGRLLEKDMDKIQDEYEKERKELSSALNDAHRNQDASSISALEKQLAQSEAKNRQHLDDKKNLRSDIEDLKSKLTKEVTKLSDEKRAKSKEMEQLKRQIDQLKEKDKGREKEIKRIQEDAKGKPMKQVQKLQDELRKSKSTVKALKDVLRNSRTEAQPTKVERKRSKQTEGAPVRTQKPASTPLPRSHFWDPFGLRERKQSPRARKIEITSDPKSQAEGRRNPLPVSSTPDNVSSDEGNESDTELGDVISEEESYQEPIHSDYPIYGNIQLATSYIGDYTATEMAVNRQPYPSMSYGGQRH